MLCHDFRRRARHEPSSLHVISYVLVSSQGNRSFSQTHCLPRACSNQVKRLRSLPYRDLQANSLRLRILIAALLLPFIAVGLRTLLIRFLQELFIPGPNVEMAWRSSGASNSALITNLVSNGLIKESRVKNAMLGVRCHRALALSGFPKRRL